MRIQDAATLLVLVLLSAACGDDTTGDGGTAGVSGGAAGSAGVGNAGLGGAGVGAGTAGVGNNNHSGGDGQITDAYRDYCVATFTSDYEVIDVFGDPQLTIESGEEYLIADFGSFSPDEVHVLYLSDAGPVELAVKEGSDGALPFTSSCDRDAQLDNYVGIFTDITVYRDAERKDPACMIDADTIHPSNGLSYQLVSDLFATPSVYQIEFDGLAELCDGVTSGYVEAGTASVGGTEETVVPLARFLGP